jgi:hypothetical protein
MSLSASSTADMVRLKQGGKRVAIAAEAAARKEDLEIPDVPKSDADLKVIGALPPATCNCGQDAGLNMDMCKIIRHCAQAPSAGLGLYSKAMPSCMQRLQSRTTCCSTCCRQLQGVRSLTA